MVIMLLYSIYWKLSVNFGFLCRMIKTFKLFWVYLSTVAAEKIRIFKEHDVAGISNGTTMYKYFPYRNIISKLKGFKNRNKCVHIKIQVHL